MIPLYNHIPVLLQETLAHLNLRTGHCVIDCTLGLGDHSSFILKTIGPQGKLMAFEQDADNLKEAKKRLNAFDTQIIYVHDNFERLAEMVKQYDFRPHAILFDLGLSSPHVEHPERGFSFKSDGPLDMRFDQRNPLTAEHIVNGYNEKELADILFYYGDETRSRLIAKKIVEFRKKKRIKTTLELADLIQSLFKGRAKMHPATQTFQALRIAVNRELDVLEKALDDAINSLLPGGRIAVISYHSLEDRITKQKFRYYTQECICPKELPICQCNFEKKLYILTKKPIIPSGIEVSDNPRSRSAKLRVAERL